MKKGETFSLQRQAFVLNWRGNENTEHHNGRGELHRRAEHLPHKQRQPRLRLFGGESDPPRRCPKAMNKHAILSSAANFNAFHDYDLDAVLEFATVAVRHAHLVQIARVESADPQLKLPLDGAEEVLP